MIVKEYLESSTIHGLVYIANSRRFVRLFWILTVLSGFIGAGTLIYQSFESWSISPVTTVIETLPVSHMEIPKVEIENFLQY